MHHRVHLGADADRAHDLDPEPFDQVAGDDDLSDQSHAQASVLGLDDHDPLASDELALHIRFPENDNPIHAPVAIVFPFFQGEEFLNQETPRVTRLGIPSGHLGLMFAHIF